MASSRNAPPTISVVTAPRKAMRGVIGRDEAYSITCGGASMGRSIRVKCAQQCNRRRSQQSTTGQLPDLHACLGHRVEPLGLGRFVTLEQAVDGVVLFDVAAGQLQEDDAPLEVVIELVRRF